MVHVVFAGGSGNVGLEIVNEVVAQGKHQVTVFSRRDLPHLSERGINVAKVNYLDKDELTAALQGVHTVFSFVVDMADTENTAQKNLIAACITAGVRRFAPNEWAIKSNSGFPGYFFKDTVHEHLKEINAKKAVLEYCLFQPGIFMNYLAYPHKTAKHLFPSNAGFDFQSRKALMVEEGETWQTFTTIEDTAKVVARAIDYEGKWPEFGGLAGSTIQTRDVVKLIEKYSGGPVEVHRLEIADLEKGHFNSSWTPPFDHPSMTAEQKATVAPLVFPALNLAVARGAMTVDPTWNVLLPDLKFTDAETFLAGIAASLDRA